MKKLRSKRLSAKLMKSVSVLSKKLLLRNILKWKLSARDSAFRKLKDRDYSLSNRRGKRRSVSVGNSKSSTAGSTSACFWSSKLTVNVRRSKQDSCKRRKPLVRPKLKQRTVLCSSDFSLRLMLTEDCVIRLRLRRS